MQSTINNEKIVSQIKEFQGLRWEKIGPTDIDAFIDFGDRAFFIIELKYKDSDVKYGQKKALERLCDACQTAYRDSIVILATHDSSVGEKIICADAIVKEVRYKGEWFPPLRKYTVKELVESYLSKSRYLSVSYL